MDANVVDFDEEDLGEVCADRATLLNCKGELRLLLREADERTKLQIGRVAEWLMAPVLKTGVPERVSGVRIPPLPPFPLFDDVFIARA